MCLVALLGLGGCGVAVWCQEVVLWSWLVSGAVVFSKAVGLWSWSLEIDGLWNWSLELWCPLGVVVSRTGLLN